MANITTHLKCGLQQWKYKGNKPVLHSTMQSLLGVIIHSVPTNGHLQVHGKKPRQHYAIGTVEMRLIQHK